VLIQIQALIDDARCFEMVRVLRWPEGVRCAFCSSPWVSKRGKDDTQIHRQRYECRNCVLDRAAPIGPVRFRQFDDLTGTVFARLGQNGTFRACPRHHQSLKVWMLCLYLMGLNCLGPTTAPPGPGRLSNRQIAHELELNKDDCLGPTTAPPGPGRVQAMTQQLRQGIVDTSPALSLEGTVEIDEVYGVAGHKGQPGEVQKRGVLAKAAHSQPNCAVLV